MALLQISEPGQALMPHEKRMAVGIDLGTTNSLVAIVKDGKADTITNLKGHQLLPSVVHYGINRNDDLVITVGLAAKKNGENDPQNTIRSIKRLMGRKLSEIDTTLYPYRFSESENGLPLLDLPNAQVNAIQVSSKILVALAERINSSFGEKIDGAVITVPAYFDDAQRQATKDAAKLAGLPVLRLLNEPTAAAIAYGLDAKKEGIIAVYDLGGGTFDISILRLNKGVFEVLATGGDSALGGDDFDQLLIHYIKSELELTDIADPVLNQKLTDLAITAKIALSEQTSTVIEFEGKSLSITRMQFNQLIDPLVKRTLQACRNALKDAEISRDEVMDIVMVGGSTRIPFVRERVGQYFKKEPLTSIDPDRVVAIGAAIQADILIGNKPDSDMLLLDVIPLSLGIETMGGLVEKIISRNSTIPCTRAQEFTTFKDGQTAMVIHVLQGERESVADCRSLAKFTLSGIPPMSAGGAHIRVTFQVDADGILNVSAMEKSTGVEAAIQVKPSYGLTENEIANMIKDSISHAKQDKNTRILLEKKVDAARILENLHSALDKDGNLLTQDELNTILNAKTQLQSAIEVGHHEAIARKIKALDSATQAFAERRMNHSIRDALTGQSVDNI